MKQITIAILCYFISSMAFAAKAKSPAHEEPAKQFDARMIEVAKDKIAMALKDPESARFRNVFISPNKVAVCGEVNAKNSMGGYVGFKRFISTEEKSGIDADGSYFVEARWIERCVDGTLADDNTVK